MSDQIISWLTQRRVVYNWEIIIMLMIIAVFALLAALDLHRWNKDMRKELDDVFTKNND